MSEPRWSARQFHYLSSDSHVHPFLVDLWEDVREATDGALAVSVHAANEGLVRSHLGIVQQMIEGDIEFYVLMGGVLAPLLPAMAVQAIPFAFSTSAQVHAAFDGELGEFLGEQLARQGVVLLSGGLMENGFRHISTVDRPVAGVDDLAGMRVRVPEGRIFEDAFRSLGAEPLPLYVLDLYRALAEGRIDAQENPLAVTDAFNLHEVTRSISMTGHMWSGFNLLAGGAFWNQLPESVREIVLTRVRHHVGRQRAHTEALNRELEGRLAGRGLAIVHPDCAEFRARLAASGFYERWKEIVGRKAWMLLEASTGPLG